MKVMLSISVAAMLGASCLALRFRAEAADSIAKAKLMESNCKYFEERSAELSKVCNEMKTIAEQAIAQRDRCIVIAQNALMLSGKQ